MASSITASRPAAGSPARHIRHASENDPPVTLPRDTLRTAGNEAYRKYRIFIAAAALDSAVTPVSSPAILPAIPSFTAAPYQPQSRIGRHAAGPPGILAHCERTVRTRENKDFHTAGVPCPMVRAAGVHILHRDNASSPCEYRDPADPSPNFHTAPGFRSSTVPPAVKEIEPLPLREPDICMPALCLRVIWGNDGRSNQFRAEPVFMRD